VATDQSLVQPQDTPFNFTLAATDPDGDALSYSIVTPPARGTLSGAPPNLTYTPQLNDRSTVSLVFNASDGVLTSNQATVTFTMTALNQPPVAAAVPPLTIDEDTSATIGLSASDADGDALTFQIVTQPTHGSLAAIVPGPNNTATVVYTPGPNFHGSYGRLPGFRLPDHKHVHHSIQQGEQKQNSREPGVDDDGGRHQQHDADDRGKMLAQKGEPKPEQRIRSRHHDAHHPARAALGVIADWQGDGAVEGGAQRRQALSVSEPVGPDRKEYAGDHAEKA
jgi:hypothetical protein